MLAHAMSSDVATTAIKSETKRTRLAPVFAAGNVIVRVASDGDRPAGARCVLHGAYAAEIHRQWWPSSRSVRIPTAVEFGVPLSQPLTALLGRHQEAGKPEDAMAQATDAQAHHLPACRTVGSAPYIPAGAGNRSPAARNIGPAASVSW